MMPIKNLLTLATLIMATSPNLTIAANYEVPPSTSTSGNVPYISDHAMEQCVKLYNNSKWLNEEISGIAVDRYSQKSVDRYNNKLQQYTDMVASFNQSCAGKQSESAYKAAQKLNN